MSVVGHVAAVWRYPVKSMQGEELDGGLVGEAGLFGDRAYALRDTESGHIVSAKHPRKWKAVFACRAVYQEAPRPDGPLPAVQITLPDGVTLSSADPDVHERLSAGLGRAVRLITVQAGGAAQTREADRSPLDRLGSGAVLQREPLAMAAPAGHFFDYAPLHVLSSATLDALGAEYPAGDFDARRFRPNIVVASTGGQVGFVENDWIGRELEIGADVRLAVIDPCPRCVVTTLAQDGLPSDPRILKTVSRCNAAASVTASPGTLLDAVAGVYARVARHGRIRRGDSITLRREVP